jgi:hypothetical protein
MQILVVVNLMAFMVGVLLLFSLVTPHDRRHVGIRKRSSYSRSDVHRLARFAKHLGAPQ